MALLKKIETEYGFSIEYWKIISLNSNYYTKNGNIVLAGYINQELRLGNKSYVKIINYPISEESFDEVFNIELLSQPDNNQVKSAYEYIKNTDNNFIDAQDLLQ